MQVIATQQPHMVGHQYTLGKIKPKNYMGLSIINLLFCFILGVIALVFSLKVHALLPTMHVYDCMIWKNNSLD